MATSAPIPGRTRSVRRLSRPGGVAAAGLVLAAVALTACSGSVAPAADGASESGGSSSRPSAGGTLRIASVNSDLDALDPLTGYSIDSWQILRATTRQLVTFPGSPSSLGEDNKIQGDLAKDWQTSPDGKTWTFHLRDGITYSGSASREIVAGDFVYAVKRFCDPNKQVAAINYFNLLISGFEKYCSEFEKVPVGDLAAAKAFIDAHDLPGITAPDDKTVVITSDTKNYDTLSILAMNFVTPLPEEVASRYVGDSLEFRKNFPSSGPYEIDTYEPGDRLVLTKVKDYNHAQDPARKAYVDTIEVDFTANSDDAVVQKIQAGEADLSLYLPTPPVATIQQYSRSNSTQLHSSDGMGASFAVLNTNPEVTTPASDALRKLKVRQALAYAVNKPHLVQVLGGDLVAKPLSQIVISNQLGYEPVDPYATDDSAGDPAKARALLAEAGYPNGLELNTIHRSSAQAEAVATTLKEDLAKAGITLNLRKLSPDQSYSYVQNVKNPWDLQIAVPSFAPDWQGDSTRMLLGGWLNSDGAPCGPGNPGAVCYDNPKLNALAAEAFASDDPGPVWAKADKLVSADLPWIPLVELRKVTITSDRVRNFTWANVPVNPDITNVSVAD